MASLVELADELLLEVLSSLQQDKAILCRVARVCFRLSRIVRPLLLQHVNLSLHNSYDPANKKNYDMSLDLLLRSIQENENITALIRSITIYCFRCKPSVHRKINLLLLKHPQIESLSFNAIGDFRMFKPTFLRQNTLRFLTEVNLYDTKLTIGTIIKFMFLEHIRKMTVGFGLFRFWTVQTLPACYAKKTSPVTSLCFGWECILSDEAMQVLLEAPRALENLVLATPTKFSVDLMEDPIDPNLATISPSSILQSLAPISHSLAELTFSYFSVESWARCQHDGSRLRLCEFNQLKKCSIPATFFFVSPNADSSRSGLHMLLPRSLEELEIVFHRGCGLVVDRKREPEDDNQLDPLKLGWLLELALHKMDCFPRLSRVNVTDYKRDVMTLSDGSWVTIEDMVTLPIPEQIQRAFLHSHIELRAEAARYLKRNETWASRTRDI